MDDPLQHNDVIHASASRHRARKRQEEPKRESERRGAEKPPHSLRVSLADVAGKRS
jgi:hypothetical protein